ncbi:MAG TPA: tetratricopeptide repeat protein [Bradyrhizobium sp.]|nr:tetratricopeptide repeat protein [Bradyrhizobium sp.]
MASKVLRSAPEQSGALYPRQERYADAEPLFERSLAIRERALPRDHPDVWTSRNNPASLYQAEGRIPDPLPLVERTIASGHAQLRVAMSTRSVTGMLRPATPAARSSRAAGEGQAKPFWLCLQAR